MRGDTNYNLQILIISIKSTAALFSLCRCPLLQLLCLWNVDASVTTTSFPITTSETHRVVLILKYFSGVLTFCRNSEQQNCSNVADNECYSRLNVRYKVSIYFLWYCQSKYWDCMRSLTYRTFGNLLHYLTTCTYDLSLWLPLFIWLFVTFRWMRN